MPVESVRDWGMLGYFIGDAVQENIPVLVGQLGQPDLIRHKHFGAAAASSGGVEMYGITPEAPSLDAALGSKRHKTTIHYGPSERRHVYETLNSNGRDLDVDYVMLGCPHASINQIGEAARLLAGKKIRSASSLWLFTSRAVKSVADLHGYTKTIRDAGGLVMTDTCSPIGKMLPEGTKVVALDSAKQVHYLPAIMGIEAWFGSTEDCIRAALTGKWSENWDDLHENYSARPQSRRGLRRGRGPGHWRYDFRLGGIDPMTGTVIETHHELRGVSFKDKVLVFPGAKGSSGWSAAFHLARIAGFAPKAMLFNVMTTKIALGAVVTRAPAVTDFDQDPLTVIETGDWVRVDGDRGMVEITKKSI